MPSTSKPSQRPLVGVLAIVRRGERVLLAQRTQAATRGRWTFPGGHIEFGETLIDAAMRELFEETGVSAEPVGVMPALDYIRDNVHYVLVPVVADWREGDAIANDDAGDVRWVTIGELESGEFPLLDNVVRLAQTALSL